jgi:site-specific DNA-methyltransferase (adenine-specific)
MQEWHYNWAIEAIRVAKPGAHLMAFGGTRTFHRLMVAIEDAGWEIRDTIGWIYGSGFPKSTNIAKNIDKQAGIKPEIVGVLPSSRAKASDSGFMMAQKLETKSVSDAAKEWDGWGSALKPSWEPVVLARKPLEGTLAANTLKWGTGGINIDVCRVPYQSKKDYDTLVNNYKGGLERDTPETQESWKLHDGGWKLGQGITIPGEQKGRFPANIIHDGSQTVLDMFPNAKGMSGGGAKDNLKKEKWAIQPYNRQIVRDEWLRGDSGSAARFFYCAKASRSERDRGLTDCETLGRKTPMAGRGQGGLKCKICGHWKNSGSPCICTNPEWEQSNFVSPPQKCSHPCVKPLSLIEYLLKLGSRKGALVLDPFMGSGTTGIACKKLGREFIGYELETEYYEIAEARIKGV